MHLFRRSFLRISLAALAAITLAAGTLGVHVVSAQAPAPAGRGVGLASSAPTQTFKPKLNSRRAAKNG